MYKQYQLPYAYEALEPHIDALTMETHYSKHHAAYTKNLNDAAEKAGVAGREITELLANLDSIADSGLRKAIRNNGGGYYNHNLYFSTISPDGGGEPEGALAQALTREFGGKLLLSASPNQDNPIIEGSSFVPILGIDVWEHAYYLKYKNLRADYVQAFYKVIDWKAVAANYEQVQNG